MLGWAQGIQRKSNSVQLACKEADTCLVLIYIPLILPLRLIRFVPLGSF